MNAVLIRQAHERGYRTAWSDPELVRLAEDRSWWDVTVGPVERRTRRDDQDPWLTEPPKAEQHQDAA